VVLDNVDSLAHKYPYLFATKTLLPESGKTTRECAADIACSDNANFHHSLFL